MLSLRVAWCKHEIIRVPYKHEALKYFFLGGRGANLCQLSIEQHTASGSKKFVSSSLCSYKPSGTRKERISKEYNFPHRILMQTFPFSRNTNMNIWTKLNWFFIFLWIVCCLSTSLNHFCCTFTAIFNWSLIFVSNSNLCIFYRNVSYFDRQNDPSILATWEN